MKEKPNYYAILTAEVRYAENLTDLQKLLYAEITALSNKTGECWARNKYFAELYRKSEKRISELISDMAVKKYITCDSNPDLKRGGISRKIRITPPEKYGEVTPKNTESSINTTRLIIQEEQSSSSPEFKYEESEEKISTLNPKRKFLNERRAETGRPPMVSRKMSTSQEINFEVLKLLTHFRDRVQSEHRELNILVKRDEARNKKIAKLLKSCYEFFSYDEQKIKDMIEWWIEGAGEWCQYRPENCFMTTSCEDFMNKDIKKEKEDNKGKWKCEYGHWHERGQECGHALAKTYKMDQTSSYAKNLSEKFKIKK